MAEAFIQQTGGIWPSLSLLVLGLALLVTTLILWRRYLSRRMLMRRIAELEALSAAGLAIVASELDVHALCELIASEAGKVMENQTFQVGLFDDSVYRILFWTVNGQRQETPQSYDIADGRGLVNWVRYNQKPLLIRDFEREMTSLPAQPRYLSQSPPRSAVFVPLVSGEETVGMVAAQSQEPNRFQEQDLRRLMIVANQAAAAIANARLYEQERMRAAHLELVGQIARQVNAVQDRDEIFDQVVSLTRSRFGFHPVSIFDIDPQTGDAILQASSDESVPANSARIPADQGIVGAAASSRETIVSNNTADDPRYVRALAGNPTDIAHDSLSEIAIPLIVDDRVLGVLDVQSDTLGAFNEAEQTVLEALAAEVASAIHKAQQLAWQQQEAWISTAQLQVAEAISRSEDLDEIVEAVTRLTPMLTGVNFCGVLLWNEERERYFATHLYSLAGGDVEGFQGVCVALGDWYALDAAHVGQHGLGTEQVPDWLRVSVEQNGQPVQGVYLLPLTGGKRTQIHGMMIIDQDALTPHQRDRALSGQRQLDLLNNIAQQTGLAVERARLQVAQQEEAWVNTALLQVAEAVNSLIDLNEILDTIVRLVPMLVGVESVIILMRDAEQQVFLPGPSFGVGTMGLGLLETLEISDDEYQTMITPIDNSFIPPDTIYTMRAPKWLKTVLQVPAILTISLNAQGRQVGAMLVNNQLYRESAERARLQQELDVAREIQASFLPSGSPDIPDLAVASYWQAARQVGGDFYDFLPRSDGTWGIVIADVADKGVPAALFMALSRTILRTVGISRRDPADVLMRVNEIINYDAESDLFVTVSYSIWDATTSTLDYANGGHNPPLLLRANGEHEWLRAPGIALGILPEIAISGKSIELGRGDTLILYTDGVTEAVNANLDEYGTERLLWTVQSVYQRGPQTIIEAITESVRDHTGDTTQFDDMTLVVLQRSKQ